MENIENFKGLESLVEVSLTDPENFLKIKETLTRIGIASKHEKKLYQSCLPGNSTIITEDGNKTIKEIVDSKYTGKVLSINSSGQLEWNHITDHFCRENENKRWVDLIGTKMVSSKRLVCTEDHLVAIVEDCFNPEIKFIPASDTLGKFLVRNPVSGTNPRHNISALFNSEQIEFLVGTLLGDATITGNGGIQIVHCEAQKAYIEEKQILFGGKLREFQNKSFNNKVFPAIMLNSRSNQQTKKIRKMMYVDGKKTIKNILHLITAKSLAYWYMDDGDLGSIKLKEGYSCFARLNTQGFSYEDHLLLLDMFINKFGLNPKIERYPITYNGINKEYCRFRFLLEDSKKLFNLIAPYINECMKYKLPKEYWEIPSHTINNTQLDFALLEIKEIKYISKDFNKKYLSSKLYDITVENVHNFIANDSLVHNCHILHKKGLYYICHFKELYGLDGNPITFSEDDLARRNTIVNLLEDWGLLKILDPNKTEEPVALMSQIKVIKHSEKNDWILSPKYAIGKKF